ncbi:HAD family hydrolase [Pseudactinotalea sp.]|uniref:HAD family hydrolase n=1 Tax=Pseudactinotalea sp. TaxID=1926260 RepID=UPI003B3A9588
MATSVISAPRLLLVCALDGTLTFTGERPEPPVIAALRRLAAHRPFVRIAVATSRSPRQVWEWFPELQHRLGRICCHGALTVTSAGTARVPLATAALSTVVDRLVAAGADFCLEYGTYFAASSPDALPTLGTAHRYVLPGPPAPGDLTDVVMGTVADTRHAAEAVRDVPGVTLARHSSGAADIVAAGVGTWQAVAALREPDEHLVVLGNGRDDLPMIRAAEEAYIVGQDRADVGDLPHVRSIRACTEDVAAALARVEVSALRSAL